MGDWNILGGILEEVHIHSTMVGKIWLTILFIFRMLVLGVAAEDVWNDEQTDFICNTEQPGCRNVCYDRAFPISLIRYWVLQVIFVSSPSLVYMGHALYRLRALEKERQKKKALLKRELELVDVESVDTRKRIEREMKQVDHSRLNKAPLRGSLLRTYVTHIVTRSVVEVLFMTGQYLLYGFHLHPLFKCQRLPCPNAVDCYVSRPTEKSVFMVFMQCIAGISLSLNILEIMHLGYKKIKRVLLEFYPGSASDELEDYFSSTGKKESVIQMYTSSARKATIVSAPSDYNLLEGVHDTITYPNLMKPSALLPLQQKACSKSSAHSSHECECITTATEPFTACYDFLATPKQQEAEDILQVEHVKDNDSSESTSPEAKLPEAHSSSYPTLPVSAVRRPVRAHGSFKFSTVLEGRSSDTDSFGGAKTNSRHTSPQICSTQQEKSQSPQSTSASSSCSHHHSRPPSSSCKVSMSSTSSSRRAPDLQI
ncbi:gap junction alpha-9 protein [Eucyclogobius newberryi]|uniref:gap junction alpha-9 protein n=1 Tax=Eucyclogobius newberryi TaxID=166745 RepID=UPI003B5B7075